VLIRHSLPKRPPLVPLLVLLSTVTLSFPARLIHAAGVPPASISVSPSTRAIGIGDTVSYRAIGHFSSGTTQDLTASVRWIVSNPGVASIDGTGNAKGLALGSTAVDAVDPSTGIGSADSKSGAQLAVVGAPTTLKVSPASVILPVSGTTTLKARATFSGQAGTFTVSAVRWSSSAPAVAGVDAQGRVTCLAQGLAVISVADVASGVTSTASGGDGGVNCGANVIGIKVSPARNILQLGSTRQMHAFLVPSTGTPADVTREVSWSSRSPSTVSIVADGSRRGLATAEQPGRAIIVAIDPTRGLSSDQSGGNGELLVPGTPQSVTIFPRPAPGSSLTGTSGTTLQFRARIAYQGGATQGANALVTWSSSDPTIVSVSNGQDGHPAGEAQLLRRGTVTISIVFPKSGTGPQLTNSVPLAAN
jgi:trimeric autotransporter adhesin